MGDAAARLRFNRDTGIADQQCDAVRLEVRTECGSRLLAPHCRGIAGAASIIVTRDPRRGAKA